MVSAPPLRSSVHGWVNVDHIRLCAIKKECQGAVAEDVSAAADPRSAPHKECYSTSSTTQVEGLHLNAGDDGAVGRVRRCAKGTSAMVGSSLSKTFPSELNADKAFTQKQDPAADLDSSGPQKGSQLKQYLQAPLSLPCKSTPLIDTTPIKVEVIKHIENAEVFSTQQTPDVERDNPEGPLSQNLANPTKRTHTQIQPTVTLSPNLQNPLQFKSFQPVAFLIPSNLNSPVEKVTLSSSLNQTVTLHGATTAKYHLQVSESTMSAEVLCCPHHLSMSRDSASGTKTSLVQLKSMPCSASSIIDLKTGIGDTVSQDQVSLSIAAVPIKQPTVDSTSGLTSIVSLPIMPSSQICCSTAAAGVPAQSRMINEEKHPSNHKVQNTTFIGSRLKGPCPAEELTAVGPGQEKDVPLDLSSKSKRQKITGCEDTVFPKEVLQTQVNSFAPVIPCAVVVDTVRNGASLPHCTSFNNQLLESPLPWAGISPESSINLLGTYVGVASPVLASTLQSKDGKEAAFLEDLQNPARPETISIIDQGEQRAPKRKKGVSVSNDARQCHSRCSSSSKKNKIRHIKSKTTSRTNNSHLLCRLEETAVPSSPDASQMACLLNLVGNGKTPQRSQMPLRGSSCQNSLLQSALRTLDVKQETAKCSLACTFKRGTTDTSANGNNGCNNQVAVDSGRTTAEPVPTGHQVHPAEHTQEVTPCTSDIKGDGKPGGTLSDDTPVIVTRNINKSKDNISDKQGKKEENTEETKCFERPRLTVCGQSSLHYSSMGKGKKALQAVLVSEQMGEGKWPSVEKTSLLMTQQGSSSVKAKVKHTGDAEGGIYRTKKIFSTGKQAVEGKNVCKNKQDKLQSAALQKATTSISKPHKKDIPVIKQSQWAKKQAKRVAPVMVPNQPDTGADRRPSDGRSSISGGGEPCPLEAGGLSSPLKAPKQPAESNASRTRKGHQSAGEVEFGDRISIPCPVRRPRGRPPSNRPPGPAVRNAVTITGGSQQADAELGKKRKRCKNRKYQNGEYITERDRDREDTVRKHVSTRRSAHAAAGCGQDTASGPEPEKPSGKRKFKSKHIGSTEDGKKVKTKQTNLGKRSAPHIADISPLAKKFSVSAITPRQRGSVGKGEALESTPSRLIPPEVRRLIVNKNAGETMLQRAARLGYQEVVLYCLEKDAQDLNHRDNAGYTALHEACAHGWAHIVQVLLEHGADVNCGAQDGTRPIHDAVVSDNLSVVWMLLNHGADPTLATYSGQTVLTLAKGSSMAAFLMEYIADMDSHADGNTGSRWDFYSSALFEMENRECWDFLLSVPKEDEEDEDDVKEKAGRDEEDWLLFEFSDEPHIPCYHMQVSLHQGYCNWFLLSDVLRHLNTSARLFQARYPHFEVVGVPCSELQRQVSASQLVALPAELRGAECTGESLVRLVRCDPDLQMLLGSTVHRLPKEMTAGTSVPCSR